MRLQELLEEGRKDGIVRFAVGAAILNRSQSSILLLKRHPQDFMPHLEELPSGKVEEHESLIQALKREVLEETNLTVKEILEYLGHFDYMSQKGKATRQFNFLIDSVTEGPITLEPEAHVSFRWHPIEQIDGVTNALRDILKKIQMTLPQVE